MQIDWNWISRTNTFGCDMFGRFNLFNKNRKQSLMWNKILRLHRDYKQAESERYILYAKCKSMQGRLLNEIPIDNSIAV